MSKTEVTKYANVEDRLTGNAFEVFKFTKVDGTEGTVSIKRSDSRDADRVIGILLDKNAEFGNSNADVTAVQKAISSRPGRQIYQVLNFGWQNDELAFVTVLGAVEKVKREGRELALPAWLNDKHPILLGRKGTLNAWKKQVAAAACKSSSALTAMCAAFGGPLLKSSDLQSFGINIFGRSKVGKTTALLAAASIGGIGAESKLPNHRATTASKGELGRLFSDQMLPLNEIGLLAGKRKDAYNQIRDFIYNISEGRDRIRLSQSQYAVAARAAEYRTIFVSTAEHSFDRYAEFAGEFRDEGEYARCVDVAAARPRRTTIMDRLEAVGTNREKLDSARTATIALREACLAQHGTALEAYVAHVMNIENLRGRVKTLIAQFTSSVDVGQLDGALQHAAKNFGLLFAGGVLASEAKLIPIGADDILSVLGNVFKRAVDAISSVDDPQSLMLKQLRENLRSDRVVSHAAAEKKLTKDIDGYYTEKAGKRVYTIHAAKFREWFRPTGLVELALLYLRKQDLLMLEKAPTDTQGVEWAQRMPRWPDGTGQRSYRFSDPFPSKKSKK